MNPFPPIEELLPHRGNMLLLEQMLVADDDSAICCAAPDSGAWYAQADGSMPAWIGIELMAQTIAAHAAFVARLSGKPPRPGVLLGTRAYKAEESFFPAGAALHIEARLSYRDVSGLGAYDCRIADESGKLLASAAITVYEPEDFAKFMHAQTYGETQ